jgi:thiamine biosynthesis lipoprotein
MACRFEVLLDGGDARFLSAARDALDEADRLETALTVYRETSDLIRLNRAAALAPTAPGEELFTLLARCETLARATDGAFDVTTTPLSRCWGFFVREGRVPDPADLADAVARTGMHHLVLDREQRTVRFDREGIELNLNAIGKGYAVDCIAARLEAQGVRHALVSAAASSVVALGGRGSGWSVDLTSRRVSRPLAKLRLRHGALGTSGAGEQYVEVEGVRHGHVIDPRTGQSARGVLSASVVTGDAATADALSTAFLVGGADLARRYCETHPDVLAVLTPEDAATGPLLFGRYPGVIVEAP